jgi:hypothetical protein
MGIRKDRIISTKVRSCQAVEKVFFAVILGAAKNLTQGVILNVVKDLMSSFALLRTGFVVCLSSRRKGRCLIVDKHINFF